MRRRETSRWGKDLAREGARDRERGSKSSSEDCSGGGGDDDAIKEIFGFGLGRRRRRVSEMVIIVAAVIVIVIKVDKFSIYMTEGRSGGRSQGRRRRYRKISKMEEHGAQGAP